MTLIRSERSEDQQSIREINLAAFSSHAEADLVDTLRDRGKLILSLVAEDADRLLGHIALSRVIIQDQPNVYVAGLGPMAVRPEYQKRGIGSQLVRAALHRCREIGCRFVVVIGHPEYYPRFGFQPAKPFGIRCKWDVPENVFMVLELQEGALSGIQGLANYEPEFDEV